MKRLVKNAPTANNYRSDYEPSIGLIEQIAKDTREPYNTVHPGLSANDVLLKLLNGETVKVMNPFGTEVLWTMEDMFEGKTIDKGFELPVGEQLIETYRGYHITKRPGMSRVSVWSPKGAPAGSFIETHEAARKMIDGYVSEEEATLEAAVEREALPYSLGAPRTVEGHRYSVEQQQDRKWAVFCGQGFVKGGFMDRVAAVNDARKRVKADQESGVPVVAEIGGQDEQVPFHRSPNYHGNM